jgi:DNA transposition AAA+ family ATPase
MDERSLIQRERLLSQQRQSSCFESLDETLPLSSFFETHPYKQFVEFCETCRRFRYVGICYGPAGVGKTIAARLYAQWDAVEPLLLRTGVRMPVQGVELLYPRVALYTPGPKVNARQIESDVAMLLWSLQHLEKIALHQHLEVAATDEQSFSEQLELLIIDNVHQLDPVCMNVVQGIYDRYRIGVALLGDEVLVEKHLKRLEHLRVRVGDVRPFFVLSKKEVSEMIPHFLSQLNLDWSAPEGLTLEQVTKDIYSATSGNLGLMRHFLTQIVVHLQKQKSAIITSQIVHQAYARLRMQ